jgi:hypothetical protein
MIRKVVEAKIGSSLTRYDNLWRLKLECGHITTVSRRPSNAKRPPKKKACEECYKENLAREAEIGRINNG